MTKMSVAVCLLLIAPCVGQAATGPSTGNSNSGTTLVRQVDDQAARSSSAEGLTIRTLIGPMVGLSASRSGLISVVLLHLLPRMQTGWSYRAASEEAFIVKSGEGMLITRNGQERIGAGSYLVLPPRTVHAFSAGATGPLDVYEISAPPWSKADDIKVAAPFADR